MIPLLISGSLGDVPLADVARLLQGARQTGCIDCKFGEESHGKLYFQRGEIVEAASDELTGSEALKMLSLYCYGSFEYLHRHASPSESLAIYPTEELIRFLEMQMNEARQLQEFIPTLKDYPKFTGGSKPEGFGFSESEIAIALRTADGSLSLADLAAEMKLPQILVSHTVARFRVAGLIEIT